MAITSFTFTVVTAKRIKLTKSLFVVSYRNRRLGQNINLTFYYATRTFLADVKCGNIKKFNV